MRLPRFLKGPQDRGNTQGIPPAGADPQADHPPDLAGRRRFLAEHIFVHTHVPKAAGSSLSHALAGIVGGANAMDLRLKRGIRPGQMSDDDKRELSLISGHFVYGMHEKFPQTPLYIASLREPVERAVSYYRFVLGAPNHPNHQEFQELGFEKSWVQMTGRAASTRSNEQSAIICGVRPGNQPDEALLWQRAKEDYFLIVPQVQIDDAIKRLRAAFGLPWTRVPKMNASTAPGLEVSKDAQEKILEANQLDAQLEAWARDSYTQNINRAVSKIAHHCLKDGG